MKNEDRALAAVDKAGGSRLRGAVDEDQRMRGSEIQVFTDASDADRLFELVNAAGPFDFTELVGAVGKPLIRFSDALQLVAFLLDRTPQANRVFLVTESGSEIFHREISMRDGSGIKLKADQPYNPDAVLIRLGGWLEGERMLVGTSINTTAETASSKRLFSVLKRVVAKDFRRVSRSYLGPGALEKFKAQWRLTADPSYSASEDLVWEDMK
jgi:hypothetical protein